MVHHCLWAPSHWLSLWLSVEAAQPTATTCMARRHASALLLLLQGSSWCGGGGVLGGEGGALRHLASAFVGVGGSRSAISSSRSSTGRISAAMPGKQGTLFSHWGATAKHSTTAAAAASGGGGASGQKTLVFCDLDGVLADFDAGVLAATGRRPSQITPAAMWPRIARTTNFYENLPWMGDGRDLWSFIKPYRPAILTGLPRGKWAEPQKRNWCARELGGPSEVPVVCCASKDKHTFCARRGAILIDDRESARAPWEAAGGVFVLHTDAATSISELRSLLPPLQQAAAAGAASATPAVQVAEAAAKVPAKRSAEEAGSGDEGEAVKVTAAAAVAAADVADSKAGGGGGGATPPPAKVRKVGSGSSPARGGSGGKAARGGGKGGGAAKA